MRKLEERFKSKYKVDPKTGCWMWYGNRNTGGYGQLYNKGKCHPAHRISYLLYKGTFPEELRVLHTCDNPGCVNPGHLFLGTLSDNSQDCVSKNRHTKCLRKLKESEVREVLKSNLSYRKLANLYKIGHNAIWNIRHKLTYKEISDGN